MMFKSYPVIRKLSLALYRYILGGTYIQGVYSVKFKLYKPIGGNRKIGIDVKSVLTYFASQ